MKVTAAQVFKDLEAGKWKPFYLVVGEEPFQAAEIQSRLKNFFVKTVEDAEFRYEAWDAEGVDPTALLASLETLPGLFDGPDAIRCVVCRRFEKVTVATLDVLEPYFRSPSPTTAFVIMAAKADKRKVWYKLVEEQGVVIEVAEPYEREWPKWLGYFERKLEKRIHPEAWSALLDGAGRSLSILWGDLQRVASFVGDRKSVEPADVRAFSAPAGAADVFEFADDVVGRRRLPALEKLHALLRHGESEIKLLSILLRQFRQLATCTVLTQAGERDFKTLATRIGVPPFAVGKIQANARQHSPASLDRTLHWLADCDFRLKTGDGSLLESFLLPYFADSAN